jgi:hypothetical protein
VTQLPQFLSHPVSESFSLPNQYVNECLTRGLQGLAVP